jgi:hypothetical protein
MALIRNEYIGRTLSGLPTTEEIIGLCRKKGVKCNGFTYPSNGSPIAYIKYGGTVTMGEMRTQQHVYNEFERMKKEQSGSGVKAPEIYHAFQDELKTYIVMEHIDGETVGARLRGSSAETKNWIFNQVAKAINQLLAVRVPIHSHPGPVGGGLIQNHFFRGNRAPKEYESIFDLQDHINKVYY